MALDRDLKKIPSEGQSPNKVFSERPISLTGRILFMDELKVDLFGKFENYTFNTTVEVNTGL